MALGCCEFVDSRLRRYPPDRASAVTYGQARENAMRFPHLAHRSAAVHKLLSPAATARIEPATSLSLFFPEPVQTLAPPQYRQSDNGTAKKPPSITSSTRS
jgi:hypothetical protein